jgi:valyl-tRNA synthetase
MRWHPAHMQTRYENWMNGLNGDWCVSRQRFFGVPFPVWYKVRDDGTTDHEARSCLTNPGCRSIRRQTLLPVIAQEQRGNRTASSAILTSWTPGRRRRSRRSSSAAGRPTGSLGAHVPDGPAPQAHDIIRTWLFSTVLARISR